MEDTDTILCVRIEDDFPFVMGSTKKKCNKCGAQVWLSPSAQQYEKTHKLRIICIPCGKKEIGIEGLKQIKLYSGQTKEIMNVLRSMRLN